jgi:glucosamine--fructose-6-phosphate aminotransferase (isomerizing)
MCGILGYVGTEPALPSLLHGLKIIAYRGYDSSGICLAKPGALKIVKSMGSPAKLLESIRPQEYSQTSGIAHTRWATHGEPSDINAHPHTDCSGSIAIVHNGIIENYIELRMKLVDSGHVFTSDTDSEVIVHLIEEYAKSGDDLEYSVRRAAQELEGAFAFVAISDRTPDLLVGARNDCPLIAASNASGLYFASDAAAIMEFCDEIVVLDNGQIGVIEKSELRVTDFYGSTVEATPVKIDWSREEAERGGFAHFMLKEIYDQPSASRDLLRERLSQNGETIFPELDEILPSHIEQVVLMACGTASYACAFGKVLIEDLTGIPVLAEVGSEFRYRRNFVDDRTLFVAISQSGETADTLASLRAAKAAGASVLGIVNVMGTTIARESDRVVYTRGGPENAVPSTKVFLNQLVTVELLALHLARHFGDDDARARQIGHELRRLPDLLREVLKMSSDIERIARRFADRQSWFAIGRGLDEPLAREAALKLKEVAYLHGESLPAGELKHGPIALIENGMPVLALVTQSALVQKMANNVQEIVARRGCVIVISSIRDSGMASVAEEFLLLPAANDIISPILMAVPLQLLSYYCGLIRWTNIDYPRNLAKSVTVE